MRDDVAGERHPRCDVMAWLLLEIAASTDKSEPIRTRQFIVGNSVDEAQMCVSYIAILVLVWVWRLVRAVRDR